MKASNMTRARTKTRGSANEETVDPVQSPRRLQGLTEVATPRRYDGLSMALHWLTLLLLIALFATAWAREQASDGDSATLLLNLHRSFGLLVWLATLFRLAWKRTQANAPALPATTPRIQVLVARANQLALYAILLAQPVTGILQSIARGETFSLVGLAVPQVMAPNSHLAHLFRSLHATTSTVLLALVGLHAGAALFHGIVRRDGVLGMMLPGRSASRARRDRAG
jgi:superoxide oxidase